MFSRTFASKSKAVKDFEKNYTNLNHPIAFSGINAVQKWYGGIFTSKEIEDLLAKVDSYTLHREHKRGVRNPVFIYKPRWRMEIDLLDVSQMKNNNDNVTFLVMLIDCWTRFLWVEAIKRKTADEVLAAVHGIFTKIGEYPRTLGGDRGQEFVNKKMQAYCTENNVIYAPNYNYMHAVFVERVNRTFQKILHTWMSDQQTEKYLPHLKSLTALYNKREHSSIKMSPQDAENPINHLQLRKTQEQYYMSVLTKKRKPKFKVGQTVRIGKTKGHFSRSYNAQSHVEFFKIKTVNTKLPIPTYTLSNWRGDETIKGNFYAFELTKVKLTDVFKIDRVIRTRTKNGKKQQFVHWQGFDDSYNTWIESKDVKRKY